MSDRKQVMEIAGQVIEAGEMAEGPGFTLQDDAGESIAVSGITEQQAKEIGQLLFKRVSLVVYRDDSERA